MYLPESQEFQNPSQILHALFISLFSAACTVCLTGVVLLVTLPSLPPSSPTLWLPALMSTVAPSSGRGQRLLQGAVYPPC